MDFDKILADAKLPEATVPICLRGDLAAEHAELDRQLQRIVMKREQAAGSTSLAGDGSGELIERLEALEAEMKEHTYPFRLRSLGRTKWRALMQEHPPRKEPNGEPNTEDAQNGFNRETFFEPMLRLSIIDPFLADHQWKRLVHGSDDEPPALTDGQYESLVTAAWNLNQGRVDIPFSLGALLARRTTDDG